MEKVKKIGINECFWFFDEIEPIVFPVRSNNQKLDEFFESLKEYRQVRYSWKFGKLIVRGCEPVDNVDFALALGRFIPSIEDLIRILAVSNIGCRITEWKGCIFESEKDKLEGLIGKFRLCLPNLSKGNGKEAERRFRFGGEYLTTRSNLKPIVFPIKSKNVEVTDFFQVLEKVRHVTYNWEGKIFLQDGRRVLKITHEVFARAIEQKVETSAEMLVLLSLSKITFFMTNWQDVMTTDTKDRLCDYCRQLLNNAEVV